MNSWLVALTDVPEDGVFEAALATNDAEPQQYREHERPCA